MSLSDRTIRALKAAVADPKAAAELLAVLEGISENPTTALTLNVTPATGSTVSVGTDNQAFSAVFLKDRITGQVWRLEVEDGVFQVETV